MPKRTDKDLPEGLIGVLFDHPDPRGFICVECIEDDEDINDESKCTTIFDRDHWFTGEICTRCKTLVERGGAGS